MFNPLPMLGGLPWKLIGIGALVALLSIQTFRIGGYKEKLELIEQSLEISKASLDEALNEKAVCTVNYEAVKEAHKQCMDTIRVSEADQKSTVQLLNQELADARRSRDEAKKQRDAIWKSQDCENLGRLDIAAACPAIAASMRERAAKTAAGP